MRMPKATLGIDPKRQADAKVRAEEKDDEAKRLEREALGLRRSAAAIRRHWNIPKEAI